MAKKKETKPAKENKPKKKEKTTKFDETLKALLKVPSPNKDKYKKQ